MYTKYECRSDMDIKERLAEKMEKILICVYKMGL